jgi:hypothetical protein
MSFVEDFSIYFADFGDDATLAGTPVRVIYDGPGATYVGLSIDAPSVRIASASVPTAYPGASLVISTGLGVGSYKVREHTPGGTGISLLTLSGPL